MQYEVTLHQHIFTIEAFDDDHIICGQLNGWIDLVSVEDGSVVLSKELKHVTGNITLIKRSENANEIIIGTQRGVYFALIGKGLGIKEIELARHNVALQKSGNVHMILD